MGTSQSKPTPKGGSPLVPSWANDDPPPATDPNSPPVAPVVPTEVLEPRRHSGMRRALKRYMSTGDRSDARKALGHFSRGSAGGGAGGARRLARAARVGGGVISALSQAIGGQTVAPNGFDLGSLTGQPVAQAIDNIVDVFCPPGLVDEDAVRAAIGEALTEALSGLDQFDPTAIDDYTVLVATRTFVAELVFGTFVAEQGQAAEDVSPQQAVARENDLRALIREITDGVATPILQKMGNGLTPDAVAELVTDITAVVYKEMSPW